jgi:hypothetical protein
MRVGLVVVSGSCLSGVPYCVSNPFIIPVLKQLYIELVHYERYKARFVLLVIYKHWCMMSFVNTAAVR